MCSLVRYQVEHSKIKIIHIHMRACNILCLFCSLFKHNRHTIDDVFEDFPKISEDFPKLFWGPNKHIQTFSKHFRTFSEDYVPVNSKTAHPLPGQSPGIWLVLSSVGIDRNITEDYRRLQKTTKDNPKMFRSYINKFKCTGCLRDKRKVLSKMVSPHVMISYCFYNLSWSI